MRSSCWALPWSCRSPGRRRMLDSQRARLASFWTRSKKQKSFTKTKWKLRRTKRKGTQIPRWTTWSWRRRILRSTWPTMTSSRSTSPSSRTKRILQSRLKTSSDVIWSWNWFPFYVLAYFTNLLFEYWERRYSSLIIHWEINCKNVNWLESIISLVLWGRIMVLVVFLIWMLTPIGREKRNVLVHSTLGPRIHCNVPRGVSVNDPKHTNLTQKKENKKA